MVEVKDLTGGEVAGAGAFDELMRTIKSNLQSEFDAERIIGSEYANVYLGSINAALATASQFILTLPTMNQQTLLLQEQVIQAQKQNLILDEQLLKTVAETAVVGKQGALLDEQLLKTQAETALVSANKLLTDKQVEKLTAEILLIGKQEDQLTAETALTNQKLVNLINEDLSITKAREKADAEISILNQKKLTEEAQILDVVNGNTVTGVIGLQKLLYQNQADGFIRDAEQKAAKIHADFFTVIQSTDVVTDVSLYGADGASVKAVLDKMKAGVNVV